MLTARVAFSIPGKPRGWQRSGTADGRHYVKKETAAEQAFVRKLGSAAMAGREPIVGPVSLTIDAVFAMPASWPSRVQGMSDVPHVSKPDLDNIEKLILDALNGVAWLDDAQVCSVAKRKRYGEGERVDIVLEELSTTVDHPAVRRAEKRLLEERDTLAPMAQRRRKTRARPVAPRAEPSIGKRLK